VDEYVRIVLDTADRRRFLAVFRQCAELCWSDTAEDIRAQTEPLIHQAFSGTRSRGVLSKITSDVLAGSSGFDGVFSPARFGLRTPWRDLDAKTMGFHPGQLIVLAGRTGKGKSAAAAQIAEYAARQGKGWVVLFSLEMQNVANLSRMACATAGVDASTVRRGELTRRERDALQSAVASFESSMRWMDEPVTVPLVCRELQELQLHHGPVAMAVIDYLQLMGSGERTDNREREVAAISRGLKRAANQFKIPIVVLCQYNREADKGGKPALNHIRESGAITHDADVVLLLHEPEGSEGETGWKTDLIVEKQRDGRTGTVRLWFDRQRTRFLED
jgi:replicative DNA helicase